MCQDLDPHKIIYPLSISIFFLQPPAQNAVNWQKTNSFFIQILFYSAFFGECSPQYSATNPILTFLSATSILGNKTQNLHFADSMLFFVCTTNKLYFCRAASKDFSYSYEHTQEFIADILDNIGILGGKNTVQRGKILLKYFV